MGYYTQIAQRISENNYPSFISLWEEYCVSDSVDLQELRQILEKIKHSEWKENFGKHVDQILPLIIPVQQEEEAYPCIRLIIDLQTSNTPELAELATSVLTDRYGEDKNFREKLRLCGLRDKKDFQGAISKFELLNHMKVGNFVFHTAGWGTGEFVDISFLCEQVKLDFDYLAGKKDLSFENAFRTLIPLDKDHFLAQRFGFPDELEKQAKENPIAVIHMLLKDLGPKTAGDIKEELYELVIPGKDWQKWWQNVRVKLKKDTFILVPDDIKEPLRLRQSEISHEDILFSTLSDTQSIDGLILTLYNFMRDFSSLLRNPEFTDTLIKKLQEFINTQALTTKQSLQIQFILEDLHAPQTITSSQIIAHLSVQDIYKLVSSIEILAFKKRTLITIRQIRSDWSEIFSHLLFQIEHSPIRDYILEECLASNEKQKIITQLEYLLSRPIMSPTTLLWYFQKIMKNSSLPLSDFAGRCRFLEAFFTVLPILEEKNNKELIKKMHTFITNAKYSNIRKLFQHTDRTFLQEILLLTTKSSSLSDHEIKILHALAEVVHPSLKKLRKKTDIVSKPEEIIWTTEVGFSKLKSRIEHIVSIEMLDNAKEIEEARAHGDLRENAEYKAALERRSRLQQELQLLSDQIQKTRVLTTKDIQTQMVGIGCIVECKDTAGKLNRFTLLGPWDADPENHIFSFQSKFAQNITGLRIGDRFISRNTEYVISSIKNYLQENDKYI